MGSGAWTWWSRTTPAAREGNHDSVPGWHVVALSDPLCAEHLDVCPRSLQSEFHGWLRLMFDTPDMNTARGLLNVERLSERNLPATAHREDLPGRGIYPAPSGAVLIEIDEGWAGTSLLRHEGLLDVAGSLEGTGHGNSRDSALEAAQTE